MNRKWFDIWFEGFWKENGQKIIYIAFSLALGLGFYVWGDAELKKHALPILTGISYVIATKIRGGKSQ